MAWLVAAAAGRTLAVPIRRLVLVQRMTTASKCRNGCSVVSIPMNEIVQDHILLTLQSQQQQQQKRRSFASTATTTTSTTKKTQEKQQRRQQQQQRQRPFPPKYLDVFVSCHPGLEDCLSRELDALGIRHVVEVVKKEASSSGAKLIGNSVSIDDILNCHLYLGTASRVLLRCGEPFKARALGELKRKVSRMPWKDILLNCNNTKDGDEGYNNIQLQLKVTAKKSRLFHSKAIEDCVIQGIHMAMGNTNNNNNGDDDDDDDDDNGSSSDVGSSSPAVIVYLQVSIVRDQVRISIDTSESPIHQRGYRLQTAKAPLREDLCVGLIYGSGWIQPPRFGRGGKSSTSSSKCLSTKDSPPLGAFIDPLCGSGTIAIEAAGLACGLPPGRLRPPPLAGTTLYDPERWEALVRAANATVEDERVSDDHGGVKYFPSIIASDRDKGAIEAAQSNARRAGVDEHIEFHQCALSSHPYFENPGTAPKHITLVTNPPFGRRISSKGGGGKGGRIHPLLPLYQTLSGKLNALKGAGCEVSALILTDNANLVRRSFGNTHHLTPLKFGHGGIPVVCLLFPH